jgi:FkbM family methyltransferase
MPIEERIDMATWCRDCDILPKVEGAGTVFTDTDGARVQRMHNGLRVLADGYCGPWMTDLIRRCHGHHEPQEERVFHELLARLPHDATMIEIGAWWSFYTLWFLQDRPARRAIALEPDPAHRALGIANAARNNLAPEFIDGFIGATEQPAAAFTTESGHPLTLPRRTVPGLMHMHGLDALDLLHCDAQGAEFAVLSSCAPLLREGRIRTIVVSTHHHSISNDPLTHQRCLALIEDCGGMVVAEHDVQESFSGDGLIVARFGPDQAGWPVIPLSRNRTSTSLFRNPLHDLADIWQA